MVEVIKKGAYLVDGQIVWGENAAGQESPDAAREKTIAYSILRKHDKSTDPKKMRLKFDALISHDITFVGIIQTAKASGPDQVPHPLRHDQLPQQPVRRGRHHQRGMTTPSASAPPRSTAASTFPSNQAVIHQYARERLAGCGKMILGSDSHTRYGAYGCMGVGEGGGELVKQLLENTYDVAAPEVVMVYLEGKPRKGVGAPGRSHRPGGGHLPQRRREEQGAGVCGPGVKELSCDFRIGGGRDDHGDQLPDLHLADRRGGPGPTMKTWAAGGVSGAEPRKRRLLRQAW